MIGPFKKRRATLRIENRTAWNTAHLRAFVQGARREVFGAELRSSKVVFVYSRHGYYSGLGSIGGSWSKIRMPAPGRHGPVNKAMLARLIIHELSHNAGLRVERDMPKVHGAPLPWAEALPLDLAPAKAKPDAGTVLDKKLAAIDRRQKQWATRAKRAATALKKLAASRRRIEKRMAAMKGGDQ